ncbi:MAG: peptidoglycan DD-metalloendopeptidase family protein [Firmicutes bacterium]|nr:peptidoglycan DD-metalloendopeptidase family protein [Bacillota bacterium]MDY5857140.1 peptidoglycan DD-metalloendopeptidase family protein [Anaerovoracaceae bacterium]
MAKIKLNLPKGKKEKPSEKPQKRKRENGKILIDIGAAFINLLDDILDEAGEIGKDGGELIIDVAAGAVSVFDKTADVIDWIVGKTFILAARKLHDGRVKLHEYHKELIRLFMVALIGGTAIIALVSLVTDYEYAYNGRTLGIVRDQQDVLQILDLVSEELTQEYGSSITIDPETDITFTPVFSYGKEIDDADTVLKRFTYMGDIQAQACAIYADGERIAIVESEKVADEVLNKVLENFQKKDDNVEYEYIGFAEDIAIRPYNTSLSNVMNKNTAYQKIESGGQQEVTYTVEAGDTLSGICEKLNVSLEELQSMNEGLNEDTTIHVGDEFVISQEVPLLTVETIEVSTYAQKLKYKTEYKESDSYYEGEKYVTQSGKNGKARITARITRHNGKVVDKEILEKTVITSPVNKIVVKGTRKVPPTSGTGTFMRPVSVPVYSGYGYRWGRMHYGIDLSCGIGTPIHAADGGTVTYAGIYYSYGYTVIIDHQNGYTTLYAHCSQLNVSAGQKVYKGQTIALVGNTGRSTGPHCHFEIKKNGVNVNPSNYV